MIKSFLGSICHFVICDYCAGINTMDLLIAMSNTSWLIKLTVPNHPTEVDLPTTVITCPIENQLNHDSKNLMLFRRIKKIKKKLIILSRLTILINLFQCFKSFMCKLSKLRCKLSEIYLPQARSSDKLTYFLTYLYLFSNKYVKYQLRTFLVFLMSFDSKPLVGCCVSCS